jgi:glutathione-specific gamma-glutamylcyclotransferase
MASTRWMFGYGSLIWNPGFSYQERRPARLKGYHRDFCMVSTRNRGTEQTPGLVLSLCPGGEVVGMAFAYDAAEESDVFKYLDDREGIHRAHERCVVPVEFLSGDTAQGPTPRTNPSWTYLPVLTAPNYDCTMPLAQRAALVAQGCGKIGTSYEYLRLLLEELDKLQVTEASLTELFAASRRLCEQTQLQAAGK